LNPEEAVAMALVRAGVNSDLLFAQANIDAGEILPVIDALIAAGMLEASGPTGARQYGLTARGEQETENTARALEQKWADIVAAMEGGEKDRFLSLVKENEKWIGVMAFSGMIGEDDARAIFDAANRLLQQQKDDSRANDIFSDMLQTHLGSYVKYD
jgi:predicted transcriptional regulator